jgi:hypothetical protein
MTKNPKYIMEKFAYVMAVCHTALIFIHQSYIYTAPIMLLSDIFLVKELRKLNLANR